MIIPRFNILKCFFLTSLLFSTFILAQKKFVLVLDAGHGGSDTGAKRNYADIGLLQEKDVTLGITLKLGKLLEKNKDLKVIFTRTTDNYPSLTDRTNLANQSKADLFIAIHCNSSKNLVSAAYGTETYVQGPNQNKTNLEVAKRENDVIFLDSKDKKNFATYNPSSPESLIALKIQQSKYLQASLFFGSMVEDNFVNKNKRLSRGVKQDNLHVLRLNAMPSVLIETGFINNTEDGHYLGSEEGQNEIATSIYDAIISYKNLKGNAAVVVPEEPKKPVEVPSKNDFRIMLMSTPVKYNEGDPALKGLDYILTIKENGFYKYYYSTTNMLSIRDNNLKTAKDAGFRNAFAVGFIPNQTLGSGYYRLELLVTKDKLNSNSYILTSLKDVKRDKENGIFYYTYGNFHSLEQAVEAKNDLEKKGIKNTVIEKVLNN